MKNKTGILEQIKSASSVTMVESLLAEGKSFKFASDDTRRKWVKSAQAKINQINAC